MTASLARPVHQPSAATAQLAASAAFRCLRVLDDLFKVASGPLGCEPLHLPPFAPFRSRPDEQVGLAGGRFLAKLLPRRRAPAELDQARAVHRIRHAGTRATDGNTHSPDRPGSRQQRAAGKERPQDARIPVIGPLHEPRMGHASPAGIGAAGRT